MSGDGLPIVFIHYGPSWYLRRALRAARRSNPDKRIILLGDESNHRAAAGVAEYFPFQRFEKGGRLAEFDRVFQVIQGREHRFNKKGGTEFWLRFVFRRWFILGEFLESENVDSFWTFDSDTLLLAELGSRERRYRDFPATTQCRGKCLNGWVGSRALVGRYLEAMIEMFGDPEFLKEQRRRLDVHSGQAFNEMDAFAEFARREGVVAPHAAEAIEGEAFDDALALVPGYVAAEERVRHRIRVKALWRDDDRGLYSRREEGGLVRWLSCNMSWMPPGVWRRIESFVLSPEEDHRVSPRAPGQLKAVSLAETLWDRLLERFWLRGWGV